METTVHLPCSNVFRAYRNETLARNGSNHSPTLTLKKNIETLSNKYLTIAKV